MATTLLIDPQDTTYQGVLELSNGKFFDLQRPQFYIEDIAQSLAYLPRFSGRLKKFVSVAEHSVIVSLLMQELDLGDPMEGLLHDAHECIIGDLSAPIKGALGTEWKALDSYLERTLRVQFDLPSKKSQGCVEADWLSMWVEAWYGMKSRGEGFEDPNKLRVKALQLIDREGWRTFNLLPEEARRAFMRRYNELAK